MKLTQDSGDRQTTGREEPAITAGVTLKAVEALDEQGAFTRAQVAYLIALAYESGLVQGHRDLAEHLDAARGMAEIADCWAEHAQPRASREQRVARRHREMAEGVRREQKRPPAKLPPLEAGYRTGLDDHGREVRVGGPVNPHAEWPEVATPGATHLRAVA